MKLSDFIPELERISTERKRLAKLHVDTAAEIRLLESTTNIDDAESMAILSSVRTKHDLCPIIELRLADQLKAMVADANKAVRKMDAELRARAAALRAAERGTIQRHLAPVIHGRHHPTSVAAASDTVFALGRAEHTALDIENTLCDVQYSFPRNPTGAIASLLRLIERVNADFPG